MHFGVGQHRVIRRVGMRARTVTRSMGRPLARSREASVFLGAALILGGAAYPFYINATRTPEAGPGGSALLLTSGSGSVKPVMRTSYLYQSESDGSQVPRLGDDLLNHVQIEVRLAGNHVSPQERRVLLVLTGSARVHLVNPPEGVTVRTAPAHLEARDYTATDRDAEYIEYTMGVDPLILEGDLEMSLGDTEAGQTYLTFPSFGWPADFDRLDYDEDAPLNPQIPVGQVRVNGLAWFSSGTSHQVDAGMLNVGKSIASARPAPDADSSKALTHLTWSGQSIIQPQAQIVDVATAQQSSRLNFIAGVLAGLAGGFLVEGISRLRIGKEESTS